MLSRLAGWCLVRQLKGWMIKYKEPAQPTSLRLNGGVSGGVSRDQLHCDSQPALDKHTSRHARGRIQCTWRGQKRKSLPEAAQYARYGHARCNCFLKQGLFPIHCINNKLHP